MSRRLRAITFASLAALCAAGAAGLAARYRGGIEQGLGPTRTVVVADREIPGRTALRGSSLADLRTAQVPARFVPPDALATPSEAAGARTLAPLPAGSYLLASHLRMPEGGRGRSLADGRRPIEVQVSAAGTLARGSAVRRRVDVVAAEEAGVGATPRVIVLARSVPLLSLRRAAAAAAGEGGSWIATLGLGRAEALEVIQAENFSREVRLLPR